MDYEIRALEDVEEEEWRRVTSRTAKLEGTQVKGTRNPHKFDRLAELQEKIDERIESKIAIKTEILDFIAEIPDTIWRTLLIYRYIRFMTWERIAVRMHYSYRQVLNIHKAALNYCGDKLNITLNFTQ